jgi:hypothetical protein
VLQQEKQQVLLNKLNESAAFKSLKKVNNLRLAPYVEGVSFRFELNSNNLSTVFRNEVSDGNLYPAFIDVNGRPLSVYKVCGNRSNGLDDFFTETTYKERVREFIQKLMDNNAITLTIAKTRIVQFMRNGKLGFYKSYVFAPPIVG